MRDARRSTTAHAGGLVCIPPFAASRPLSAATPRSKPNRVSWRSDSRRRIVRPSSHRPRSCRAARLACACNSQRRIQTQRSKASSTCSPNLSPRPTVPVTTSSHCPGPLAVEHPPRLSKTSGSGPISDSLSPSSGDSLSGVRRPSRSESLRSDQQRLRPGRLRRSCRQGQRRSTGQTSGADVRTVHRAAESALRHGAAARALPNPRGRFPILVPRSSILLGADGASFRRSAPDVGSTSVRSLRRTFPRPMRPNLVCATCRCCAPRRARGAEGAVASRAGCSAPLLRPGIYLVREDEALIEQAVDRFEAIGLTWHAEQSRKLLART